MQYHAHHTDTRGLIARFLHPARPDDEPHRVWDHLLCGGRLCRFLRVRPWHRIGPVLAARAGESGLPVPRSLESRASACRLRNELLSRELAEVLARLDSHGIRPCLIKGAASFAQPRQPGYLPAAQRPMEDLDLVVRPEHGEQAREVVGELDRLCESGSQPIDFRLDAPALIDVHVWSPDSPALGFLPLESFFDRALQGTVDGREATVLRPEHYLQLRLAQNVIRQHAFVDFSLVQLHELAGILDERGCVVDWNAVRSIGLMHGVSRVFYAVLLRLHDEFGRSLPAGAVPQIELGPARRVQSQLDRLAGVSGQMYGAASRHALIAATPGDSIEHVNRAIEELVVRPADDVRADGPLAQVLRPLRTAGLHLLFHCRRVLNEWRL